MHCREQLIEIDSTRLDMPLLMSAGCHSIDAAIPSEERQTSAFHITYVSRQSATWLLDSQKRLVIQAGQIGIIQPQSIHQGEWAVDHPNFHFWFYFHPQAAISERHTPFSRDWLDAAHHRLLLLGNQVTKAPPAYAGLCEKFYQHLKQASDLDYLWLRSLISQIFLLSLDAFQNLKPSQSTEIDEILRVLEDRLLDWPKVAALADYFAMDETQFQRLFKKATGMSPWNYIIRARCHLACTLLRQKNSSITHIAHELGFSSSQHFSTVFRRFVGHTPGMFRTLHASEHGSSLHH